MGDISRIICLSANAFSVLAAAYGIEKILWMEAEHTVIPADNKQEAYLAALFELKQQNMILVEGKLLKAEESVDELFRIIRDASCIVSVQGRKKDSVDMCLYIDKKGRTAVLRKGNRKKDYVKLEKKRKEDIYLLLEEGGHLPESLLQEAVRNENQIEEEVEGKIRAGCLAEIFEKNEYDIFKEQEEVETYIKVYEAGNIEKPDAVIIILHFPIQDIILCITKNRQNLVSFSKENMEACIAKF